MLPATGKETESSSLLPNQICQRFSIDEILLATKSFDDSLVIGRGGFGKVYKGPIRIGSSTNVAIKRLHSMSNQGESEFWAEVEMLSQLRHCNLVSLIGYCNDKQEMILVYEYMPHGTLEDHLHKVGTPLSWLQRLKICVGAARGLDYLHTGTGTQHGVIHRDVKSSNILLDENFAAKISDFGLAKIGPTNQTRTHVSTGVKGTFGYMDPCYFYTGKLTRKSDVYAFGVVLLEVLCGRPAVDETLDEEQWGLATWAQDRIKDGKLSQIVDSRLRGQISTKCLKEFARIAGHCLHNHPKQRLTMAEVVVKLEFVLSLQESMNSSVNEHTLIERVRSYLTSNFNNLMKSDAVKSNDGPNDVTRVTDDASNSSQNLKIFTYAELVSATVNFKHGLFRGRNFDETPYKGWVDERTYSPTEFGAGMAIFVRQKRLWRTVQLDLDYLQEFNHPNLVKLLGYCSHDKEFFYVYEYVPNGSLDRLLFKEPGTSSLPWVLRIKIAIGAAQGLSFLHRTMKQATYSQFKTSVILLDADFTAKLSDFKLQKSWLGEDSYYFNIDAFYAAPEWFSFQIARLDNVDESAYSNSSYLDVKNEVYAFGVVLLEILTGKKVYDVTRPQGKENLVKWASPLLKDKENFEKLLDPELKHEYHLKDAFQLSLLISKCLESTPERRPSMEEVLQVLYSAIKMKPNDTF